MAVPNLILALVFATMAATLYFCGNDLAGQMAVFAVINLTISGAFWAIGRAISRLP